MRRSRLPLALLLALAAAVPARGELSIDKAFWQAADKPARPGQRRLFENIEAYEAAPRRAERKLRARLVLKNRGPRPVQGVLLRYSLTARLVPLDKEKEGEGVWAVPFMIEERRVPRIGPNQYLDVPLDPAPLLDLYLKKVARSGYWPDQLKLQAMIEPTRGEAEALQILESVLPVRR